MRKILMLIGVLVITGIGYVVYYISTFSILGDNSAIVLKELETSNGYFLKIYYSPSNATVQDAIVIMKVQNDKEELIERFERYDYLESFSLIRNDSILLVMKDTSLNRSNSYKAVVALPKQ